MEQQESGKAEKPLAEQPAAGAGRQPADSGSADSTWGVGAAAAMENLRRHNFGARRSRPQDDRPTSE